MSEYVGKAVYKKTLCIDFDGVIHSYIQEWAGIDVIPDPPEEGALEWLTMLVGAGYDVCIYSSRSKQPEGISAMRQWMLDHGMPIEFFEDNLVRFPTEKPGAYLTIDDRCICFRGTFPSVLELECFRPWNADAKATAKAEAYNRPEAET